MHVSCTSWRTMTPNVQPSTSNRTTSVTRALCEPKNSSVRAMSTTEVVQTFKQTKQKLSRTTLRFNASLVSALDQNFAELIDYIRQSRRGKSRQAIIFGRLLAQQHSVGLTTTSFCLLRRE